MKNRTLTTLLLLAALMAIPFAAAAEPAVALYDGRTIPLPATLADPNDLWIPAADLESLNGFELEPEDACYEDLCVPVEQTEDGPLFVRRQGSGWLNVSELARRLEQGAAYDPEHRVWSFGEIPALHRSYLRTAIAPDFELPDRQGEIVRLSDFRGKKVLLMTWASW